MHVKDEEYERGEQRDDGFHRGCATIASRAGTTSRERESTGHDVVVVRAARGERSRALRVGGKTILVVIFFSSERSFFAFRLLRLLCCWRKKKTK